MGCHPTWLEHGSFTSDFAKKTTLFMVDFPTMFDYQRVPLDHEIFRLFEMGKEMTTMTWCSLCGQSPDSARCHLDFWVIPKIYNRSSKNITNMVITYFLATFSCQTSCIFRWGRGHERSRKCLPRKVDPQKLWKNSRE